MKTEKFGNRADDYVPFTFRMVLKPNWWRRMDAWLDREISAWLREGDDE